MNSVPDQDTAGRFGLLSGTFLICAALLAFEISTVRTINFAIGPSYIFVAISLAMLGLTTAGSVLSLFDLTRHRHRRSVILALLCIAISLLILLTHSTVVSAKESLNEAIRLAGMKNGLDGVVRANLIHGPLHAMQIGLVLTLPYFLFGALLSFLFATSAPEEYSRLYAADLIGAALGCAGIVAAMEWTGYAFSVSLPVLAGFGAAMCFARKDHARLRFAAALGLVAFALLPLWDGYRALIEPGSDPNYLVRDYKHETAPSERWVGWNSFTRVAAIEETGKPGAGAVLSLANGDGMAFLMADRREGAGPRTHPPVIPALIAGVPETALIVFAGAGADMMSLIDHGSRSVTGIELNARLVEAALALPDYGLAGFMAQDAAKLLIAEARSFLERDETLYDMVMVSWSGATAIYHFGALGGTTQYVFTYEGLSALLDRVAENGTAVILQVNKFDMLHGLRRYMAERGLPGPDRAAIVLYKDGTNNQWDASWDDNPLLIRLDGWTDTEISEVSERASAYGFEIAYAPGRETPEAYRAYAEILQADDPDAAVRAAAERTTKRLGVLPDNRPFILDHFDPTRYLSRDFWQLRTTGVVAYEDTFHLMRVVYTLAVALLAFVLALAPLALRRKKPASRRRSSVWFIYFVALGAGFMFVEIGLIQSTSLLYGNPGLTIAIVLGLVILSTGLGSLCSNWCFDKGLTIRRSVVLVCLYAIAAAVLGPLAVDSVMGADLAVKLAVTAILIVPGGLAMGQLFPQGLALAGAEDASLVPWAWAINGAMSAAAAGIAPLIAQATGFTALYVIGAGFYALAFLLPLARQPVDATPAVS
ncbi:hypothetical protein EI983_18855 [Roseovarius faecimaris]|uniref:Spermidine synthase n=1 Tax=Roseovarius faecimaris TaxID=2494550 RepID=A0A6I6IX95_9RHOB|nr:hypothetical protein [Roseovarius faecimaris]QGY00212.1 hypothetical protein EI983_18855 [Roseovarius faecimaris]